MHFKLFVGIIGLAIAGGLFGFSYWIYKNRLVADQEMVAKIAELDAVEIKDTPDPGLTLFERAAQHIAVGEIIEGRDLLLDLVRLYKDSARFQDSKRIIGEINMDLLLSKSPMSGKKEYVVQRGDSMALIAGRQKTTYDYLMRVNGLFGTTLHPGDKLTVFPLDLSVVVKEKEKTLTLLRKGRFFKEYPVDMVAFPPNLSPPFATKVSGKAVWRGNQRVRVTDPGYPDLPRWITLDTPGFMLLPKGTNGQPKPEQLNDPEAALEEELIYGVFLEPQDMHEIYSVLTISSEVSVAL